MLQTLPMHQVDRAVSAHSFSTIGGSWLAALALEMTAVQHDA
jgi:hypothetical protein